MGLDVSSAGLQGVVLFRMQITMSVYVYTYVHCCYFFDTQGSGMSRKRVHNICAHARKSILYTRAYA